MSVTVQHMRSERQVAVTRAMGGAFNISGEHRKALVVRQRRKLYRRVNDVHPSSKTSRDLALPGLQSKRGTVGGT